MVLFADAEPLHPVVAYLCVVAGILLSVVIPYLWAVLKPPPQAQSMAGAAGAWFKHVSKRYGMHLVASLVIGLLAFAIAKSQNLPLDEWWQALLFGYTWDSTMEKFTQRARE